MGEQTRQRTVFNDELLELLKIELLLSTSSTHILCREVLKNNLVNNASIYEQKRLTKMSGVYEYRDAMSYEY